MGTLTEEEIETARAIARAHYKAILNNPELLVKFMEVTKMSDLYMTVCLVLMAIKNLEKKEEGGKE